MSGFIFTHETRFNEDGSCDVRARVMAKDATGATAKPGEGYAIQRDNLSSISMSIFDITDPDNVVAPAGVTNPTALTIADVISDTLNATAALWKTDSYGFNFAYVLPPASFPVGANIYQVEFLFTTSGGAKAWLKLKGQADKVYTS